MKVRQLHVRLWVDIRRAIWIYSQPHVVKERTRFKSYVVLDWLTRALVILCIEVIPHCCNDQ
jgi:hypothetical protein